MANVYFISTTGAEDWNNPANWEGGVLPTAADTAVIAADAPGAWAIIQGGASDSVANVLMDNTGLVVGGSTDFGGSGTGQLTATGQIIDEANNIVSVQGSTITADGGFFLTTSSAALGGGGTFDGAIINQGVVDADGGDYGLGGLFLNGSTIESPAQGTVAGTGYLRIAAGSVMELNAPTSETVLVDYSSRPGATTGAGILALDQPSTFTGILNIAALNSLDLFLGTGQTISGVSVTGSTLSVNTSTGVDNFALAGGSSYTATLVAPGTANTRGELTVTPHGTPGT